MKKLLIILFLGFYCAGTVHAQSGEIPPLTWVIAGDELIIRGIGDMPYHPGGNAPWYDYKNSISNITIEEGVTSISPFSFFELTNATSISISGTVTRIEVGAFLRCENLPTVHIPASVTSIGEAALSRCHKMTSITVDPANPAFSTDNGFLFDKEKTMIVACIGGKTDNFTIPNTVKTIGKNAFSSQLNLTTITIPASVTTFNDFAFSGCTNLSSISLPTTLTEIGYGSFSQCTNLAEIINANPEPQTVVIETFLDVDFKVCVLRIPAESYHLYETAAIWKQFQNKAPIERTVLKTGKIGSITWDFTDDNVLIFSGTGDITNEILDDPVVQNIQLDVQRIVINEGITGLAYCWKSSPVISLFIPASVTTIYSCFSVGYTKLASITVHADNPEYASVDGVLFNNDKTMLLTFPAGRTGHYEIPSTVIVISDAFYECQLSSITIPSSVKTIVNRAFMFCHSLTFITIPYSVTNMDGNPFFCCESLTSIDVEAGNTNYSSLDGVMFNFDKTTLIAFPSGRAGHYDIPAQVKNIGSYAFVCCHKLSSVNIHNSVESIGNGAFSGSSLNNVFIPASVISIEAWAFSRCYTLTSIEVHEDNDQYSSEDGVLYSKDKTILFDIPPTRQGRFIIPESVNTIGVGPFYSCEKLTSVVFQGKYTFMNGNHFYECSSLREIIFLNPKPQEISPDLFFEDAYTSCTLRVPAASVELYKASEGWKMFNKIEGINVISLDYSTLCLLTGAEKTLSVTLDECLPETQIEWTSTNTAAATVNSTGKVTAIKPGTADITVSAFGNDARCTVTVIAPGNSTIKGTVDNAGTSNVRVNLYVKLPDSDTKKGIIGGYVLLATTVPNDNGEYSFENLPEGSYKVDVEMDEYESEATPAINLSGNETRSNINFEVDGATGTVVPKIVTGTVETGHAPSLQIYPNPFTDVVRINVQTGRAPSLQVQIFNTAGTIVHTQIIANPDETIHLGHLPVGMYFIRLENGQTIKTIKIQ